MKEPSTFQPFKREIKVEPIQDIDTTFNIKVAASFTFEGQNSGDWMDKIECTVMTPPLTQGYTNQFEIPRCALISNTSTSLDLQFEHCKNVINFPAENATHSTSGSKEVVYNDRDNKTPKNTVNLKVTFCRNATTGAICMASYYIKTQLTTPFHHLVNVNVFEKIAIFISNYVKIDITK